MTDLVLEEVARDLLLVAKQNLNDAIDAVWQEMEDEDTDYYAALGESVPVTPKPYPVRFFLGHHPSVLDRPVADYPNITAVSYDSSPGNDTYDQVEVVSSRAYIEAFVVHADESTVNRLAWRYAKALHRILTQYKELADSRLEQITDAPRVLISNASARRIEEFKDDIVFIQGCRLESSFRSRDLW